MLYDWYVRHKKLGIGLAVAVLVIAGAAIGVGTALRGDPSSGSGGSAATISCWATSQDSNVVIHEVIPASRGPCSKQPNLIYQGVSTIGRWASTPVSNAGTQQCDPNVHGNRWVVYSAPGDTSNGDEADDMCSFLRKYG